MTFKTVNGLAPPYCQIPLHGPDPTRQSANLSETRVDPADFIGDPGLRQSGRARLVEFRLYLTDLCRPVTTLKSGRRLRSATRTTSVSIRSSPTSAFFLWSCFEGLEWTTGMAAYFRAADAFKTAASQSESGSIDTEWRSRRCSCC